MAIAVTAFFPQTIVTQEDNNILRLFKLQYNPTTNEVILNETGFADPDLNTYVDNSPTESGIFQSVLEGASDFFQSFVDGLKNVLGVVKIMFKFLFSPFIFVLDPELMGSAPFYVKLIFAIPLVFMALMGLVQFVRGFR
jgi:hypothetical protein